MENNNLYWCGLLVTCETSWTITNSARRFLSFPNYLDPNISCNYFRWVDDELPSQWYQRMMYLLHVNLRAAQYQLRTAQDELVQANVERGRVAFLNKMLKLLVLAMFLVRFM
ncbi:hypothetical protein Tco_0765515 [Tanacetum coccineum]